MPRPQDTELKNRIRSARAEGKTIQWLMENFHLSRNTVFYHLREDKNVDKREHYTEEDRLRLAAMNTAELEAEARRTGKTFQALQRVAYRTRTKITKATTKEVKLKVELRGYLDWRMETELRAFGLDGTAVELCKRRIAAHRLKLTGANKLEAYDGRYVKLKLDFQMALIKDPIATLVKHQERIRKAWRVKE